MKRLVTVIPLVAVLSWAGGAAAIPRFAARTGMECIQCHVSPSGAGVRNSYGRNVFELAWLPLRLGAAATTADADLSDEEVEQLAASVVEGSDELAPPFSGETTPARGGTSPPSPPIFSGTHRSERSCSSRTDFAASKRASASAFATRSGSPLASTLRAVERL